MSNPRGLFSINPFSNTWGLYSINRSTFNVTHIYPGYYPKAARDLIYTAFKVNNLVFNVLGYIPATSVVSGTIRMLIGIAILATALKIGDPNATVGPLIGRFYNEAVYTGIAQIIRGALEAYIPAGIVINIALDVIATLINVIESETCDIETVSREPGCHNPHEAPVYPLLLKPLHFV